MGCHSFNDLIKHFGHRVFVVHYSGQNVAIECEDCHEVLLDFDRECNHKNELGDFDYEKYDDRISTDRGTFGEQGFQCRICGEDITELLVAGLNEGGDRDEED
jgi:hypothetical protein